MSLMVTHDACHNLLCTLRFYTDLAGGAHLRAEFHVEQTQKMMDFSHGGNG